MMNGNDEDDDGNDADGDVMPTARCMGGAILRAAQSVQQKNNLAGGCCGHTPPLASPPMMR